MSTIQKSHTKPVRIWRGVDADERVQSRRERFLEAGLEVYAVQGYANAKVQRICLEAGLTQRYFYESFDDKEALLNTLVVEIFDEAFAAMAPALERLNRPLDEVSREALGDFLDSFIGDPRRARVALIESVGVSVGTEQCRRTQMAKMRDLMREVGIAVLGKGAPTLEDADMTARALVGATFELLVSFVLEELDVDRERLSDHLVQLFTTSAPIRSRGTT